MCYLPLIMSLIFEAAHVIGTIIIPLYSWGNSFREKMQIFSGRKTKIPFDDGFQRQAGELITDTLKKRNKTLCYLMRWKTLGKVWPTLFPVSKTTISTGFITHPCSYTAPLTNGNCIYKIWRQWPKSRPQWQSQNQSNHQHIHILKGWNLFAILGN